MDHDDSDLLGAEGSNTILEDVGALDERVEDRDATRGGLVHLAIAVGVLSLLAAVPYASSELVRWRAWVGGEGVPVVRMFDPDRRAATGESLATGGAYRATGAVDVADQLGEDVAANLEDDDQPTEPVADVEPVTEDDPTPTVVITADELEGLAREIEDPSDAMTPFYEALRRTAERQPRAITRVAHYGDSTIAGDGVTSTLRRRLQQRFGDAGHGFVLVARGSMPYGHRDLDHDSDGMWDLDQLVRAGRRDHIYGYGGVMARSVGNGTARFETAEDTPVGRAVSRFELWYREHPRGGRVALRVDRGEREIVSTRGETERDAWHVIEVPDGPHELRLQTVGGGESRLFGVVLERDGPGVVYDSLGMVGARARRMNGLAPEHFASQHQHRETDLIVLHFGGNDADDTRRTPEQFEQDFREIIQLARAARPEAGCLLMAPLDQAHRDRRGRIATMPQVPVIVAAQRRAAEAEGCAFFDTWTAMGGDGAMRRWWRSDPRLAFGDFRHATPAGYRVIGNMLYRALLKGFRDYLTRSR